MRIITALFDTYEAAGRAVNALRSSGVANDDISIVANHEARGSTATAASNADDGASGAGTGAAVGAALGGGAGMLAGLGMLAIPGLGPLVAAGWLAATLTGAVAGGAAGGLIGGLTGAGLPEEAAHKYAEGIRRGGTLVTVRAAEGQVDRAAQILDEQGAVDIDERSAAWRRDGWSGRFEDSAASSPSLATSVPDTTPARRRARDFPANEPDDRRRTGTDSSHRA